MMRYIYKIYCETTKKTYYGSTKHELRQRLWEHEYHYREYKKGKLYYQSSCDILENNNYKISIVEEVCEDVNLKDRERYYIENFECVNIKTPNKTHKEYKEDNKEKIKKYHKLNQHKYYKKQNITHKNLNQYRKSWGGDFRSMECNLLKISTDLFT